MPRQLNLAADARRGLFETERHVVTQIRAALPARPAASAAPTRAAEHFIEPEKIAENILKFLEDRGIEAGIESAIAQPSRSVAVVHRALLLVGKYGIGFGSRAKIVLGLFFLFRIAVGMPLESRLTVCGFDLLGRSIARHTQNLVKIIAVAGRHRSYVSG